jgi:membrane-associated phospholipid phosphatase
MLHPACLASPAGRDQELNVGVFLSERLNGWRGVLAGPVVAVCTGFAAVLATSEAGVPLRDPGHVGVRRFVVAAVLVALLAGLDTLVRASRRSGRARPPRAALRQVWGERWTPTRLVAVGSALISFYVTYLAYRNLKSVVPLLRRGELFDGSLGDLDRSLFSGSDPAALLHTLLGTGISAHLLSAVYGLFFIFVPLSLALALVFSRDVQAGVFFVTALSVNWALAAASYFLLPSLGPVYAEPAAFADLPTTAVTQLQSLLLDQRIQFLRDPTGAGSAQSIGAFASLHVSIVFTAALATHLLRLGRPVKIAAWGLFALTVIATIYLGWHYVLDDLGGVIIAVTALALARALTGFDLRRARRPRPAPNPAPA